METEEDRLRKKRHFHKMLHTELPKSFGSSQRSFGYKRSKNDESLDPLVDSLFKKQFSINNTNFKTPDPETMFTEEPWSVTELQELKIELNEIKNKLNDYDIAEWHQHTRRRNRAGDVQWRLRKEIDPEFLTQAWCKFYESVSLFPLIPKAAIEAKKLVSVHLCEAPGAFVTSLNHWLKLNASNVQWDWMATTLNPYYEGNPLSCMINDDRFIISSLNQWCFGADYTGNLMSLKNMDHVVEKAVERGDILLVTADGSIDCTNDPGEQESVVAPLHFCEAVTAMHLLSKHGSLLLKMFTIFEHNSLCLVYLISCLFDQVIVNKPVTSKEGNSEVYLVCLDYRGSDFVTPYLNVLREHFENRSSKAMFCKNDVPPDFVEQMISCGKFFKAFQGEVILKNIETYNCGGNDGHIDFETKKIKRMVATKFLAACQLKRLKAESSEVVGKTKLAYIHSINLDPRIPDGSYNERRTMGTLEPEYRLLALCQNVNFIEIPAKTKWFTFAGSLDTLHIDYGKSFLKVQSSKFCMGKFLKIRNSAFDLLEKLGLDPPNHQVQSIQHTLTELDSGSMDYKYLCFDQSSIENNKETLTKINDKLTSILKGESLVLIGYSLITQLNVGVLYILAHMFQSLGLILNEQLGCIIILKYNLLTDNILECFKEVHKATVQAETLGESVLSVIPITKVCGKQNPNSSSKSYTTLIITALCLALTILETDLYPGIVDANHWSIKHYINNISDYVQKKWSINT